AADTRCSFSRCANTLAMSASTCALSFTAVSRRSGRTKLGGDPPAQASHGGSPADARDWAATPAAAASSTAAVRLAATRTSARLADFNFHELHGGRAGVAHLVRDAGVEEGPVADVVERPQARALGDGSSVAGLDQERRGLVRVGAALPWRQREAI